MRNNVPLRQAPGDDMRLTRIARRVTKEPYTYEIVRLQSGLAGWQLQIFDNDALIVSRQFPLPERTPAAAVDWWINLTTDQRREWGMHPFTWAPSTFSSEAFYTHLMLDAYDKAEKEAEAWIAQQNRT